MTPTFPFAVTILSLAAPSAQFTHYEDNSCHIIGDPDVYGIGVRISYYLTFLSGTIALVAGNHRAVEDIKKGNAIIGSAIFITLIRNAVQGSLAVFEWTLVCLMISLLFSGAFIPLTIMGSRISSAMLFIIYGLYSVLLPWVFFTLADQGRNEDCKLRAFIFAYFDFYNAHFVVFQKVMSIVSCLLGFPIMLAGVVSIRGAMTANNGNEEKKIGKAIRISAAYFAITSGAAIIAITEKLITGNDIDFSDTPLDSTNQLIPFLIGLFSLISTVWSVCHDYKKQDVSS